MSSIWPSGSRAADRWARPGSAMAMNGTVPGPLLRLREGQEAVIRVTNRLRGNRVDPLARPDPAARHGRRARRQLRRHQAGRDLHLPLPGPQSGTYWAHSHSGGQELLGLYLPLIIDPVEPEPFEYDRDYVVMLSDWSFESPEPSSAS